MVIFSMTQGPEKDPEDNLKWLQRPKQELLANQNNDNNGLWCTEWNRNTWVYSHINELTLIQSLIRSGTYFHCLRETPMNVFITKEK